MSFPLLRHTLWLLLLLPAFSLFAQTPTGGDNRRCVDDARISLAFSGDTVRATCVDDDVMDRLRFQVDNFRQAFAYIVVDADDIVRFVNFTNFINFDMLPPGELRVYAFSNYGRILVKVGDTFTGATLSLPCAGLTTNFVQINNGASGDVVIESAQDSYEICSGNGRPAVVEVSSPASNVVYVITDDSGNVLGLNETGRIDFEGVPGGVCRLYALAGGLTIAPGENVRTLDGQGSCGAGLSQNFITVTRNAVAGGTITTDSGASIVEICPGDGNADLVSFTVTGAVGESSRLVITDENNVVIGLPEGNTVDFDPTPTGTCRVWNLSFFEPVTIALQQTIGTVLENNDCIATSNSFVTVVRELPQGGSLRTTDGASEVQTCPGDGEDDRIEVVLTGASGGEVRYLLTDTDDRLLNFSEMPVFNLETAPVGTCRIWAVTFRGTPTLTPGDTVTTAQLSDNCFDLSDDFVTVVRSVPAGGTVATAAGETSLSLCPGDGVADTVAFVSTGATGGNFTFVVTDEDNRILGVPAGNVVDFESQGLGVCRLWGLSYDGELLASVGQDAAAARLASDCFSLSDNFVTITRELPVGGSLRLSNGAVSAVTCPMDGIADILTFVSTSVRAQNFNLIVTEEDGTILGFPTGTSINFESVPAGICRVYGLGYQGEITANVGDNVNTAMLASACNALSDNFVTVTRTMATTGTISLEDGATEALVCPGDAVPDILRFDSTGTSLTNFNYLVTDTNNVVLQLAFTDAINFENFPAGVCRVWGLGYDGLATALPGRIAGQDPLATQCAALSENFVTVVKQIPDGGTISTLDGADEVMICPMDGVDDFVTVQTTSTSDARFFYVATTEDNVILNLQDSPTFNFEAAPFGVCRIWGLSFQGALLASPGDTLSRIALADGCADLSDNFVTVIRMGATIGTISLADGGEVTNTCPGDGMPDVVGFSLTGSSGNVIYLITNEQDTLLATSGTPEFDFDGAGEGICRVYALTFSGEFLAAPGTEVTTAMLASGCFALSENFVTVVREAPLGGTVSLMNGDTTIDVCSGDGTPDLLGFTTTSPTVNYGYIITDENIALTAITTDTFDFSNTLSGTFEVYGVAYTGELTVSPGLDIFSDELSSDCFELSENFVTVNITRVDGGDILGNDATELFFCPENTEDGQVVFSNNSLLSNENYVYVITTANEAQVVLRVIENDTFDFGEIPLMEVKVFAISYTGTLLTSPGQSLAFSAIATGCASISNNCLSVFNDSPEAGEISVVDLPANGISCAIDGQTDITVTTTSTSRAGYAVIVTDTAGIVQLVSTTPAAVPFDTLPTGDYRIYGLSYTGNVTVAVGDDIDVAVLADNCYELTESFVPVTRGGDITAGRLNNVTTDSGTDTIRFCLAAGDLPVAIVEPTVGGPNYRFIVTDTSDRVIAANLPSPIIPFTSFAPGTYRIYGFNFTGVANVAINQPLTGRALSTECFTLSTNFLTVILSDTEAGQVLTNNSERDVTVTIDTTATPPVAMLSFINSSNSTEEYAYVITDADNTILGISTNPTINFGPAGPGVCRVWGLSFAGEIVATPGQALFAAPLVAGCAELTENFVTVTRVFPEGLADEDTMLGDAAVLGAPTLKAFPNPVAGSEVFITISSELPLDGGRLALRDINGQVYQAQTLTGGSATTTVRLDLSQVPSGIYFVSYVTNSGVTTMQFVKP